MHPLTRAAVMSVLIAPLTLSPLTGTSAIAAQPAPRGENAGAPRSAPTLDVVDTAVAAKFKTLAAAIDAAGLADTLKGAGPFTIFAPTDEAFAALPPGTVESLLRPENGAKLRAILLNHVVPGRLTSFQVGNIDAPQMAKTLGGGREKIAADSNGFRFGDAAVVRANIRCSNGVIHVIDRVVLPKQTLSEDRMKIAMKETAPASILDALRAVPDGRFSMFLAAVEASGGDQDWASAEPSANWTLFVPTNDAFGRLSDAERATLLDPRNRDMLRAVLDWHALPKIHAWSFDFDDGERGPAMISAEGDRFVLDVLSNGMVFIYQMRSGRVARAAEEPFKARILAGDVSVGGCVVHVIDRLLIPPQFEGKAISSQAYPELDVQEIAGGAKARFNARLVVGDLLQEARSLDDSAAVVLYQFGLRMLDEILPVSRTGVLMMGEEGSGNRQTLAARLQSRVDDLDRVWYAGFMKNSPAATTLAGPLPGSPPSFRKAMNPGPMDNLPAQSTRPVSAADPQAVAVAAAMTPAATPQPALAWGEVLERDANPSMVTDPALRQAIARTGLPWRVRDKATGIEMLLVPPGSFKMGKFPGDQEALANEVPAHDVTLTRPFYLARYEISREQWTAVMQNSVMPAPQATAADPGGIQIQTGDGGALTIRQVDNDRGIATLELAGPGGLIGGIRAGAQFRDEQGNAIEAVVSTTTGPDGTLIITTSPAKPDDADDASDVRAGLPARANWMSVEQFCRKTGFRLPSEAEWEYACRAGSDSPRYGQLDDIAWHRGNARGKMQPVGSKTANALGFHDMIGNAWEWVNDWYGDYTRAAKTDPTGPQSGDARIVRGSYFNFERGFCRSTLRYEIASPDASTRFGFRVARNP